MSKTKYPVPDCIAAKCAQEQYSRWLHRKAIAHVRRDRRRRDTKGLTVARYKAEIHAAVADHGDRDHYTGEALDWSLISKYRNDHAKRGRREYKKQFALLPTVDHALDENGKQRFVICSWYVNDSKSDLTLDEFYQLCERVLRHREHPLRAEPLNSCNL